MAKVLAKTCKRCGTALRIGDVKKSYWRGNRDCFKLECSNPECGTINRAYTDLFDEDGHLSSYHMHCVKEGLEFPDRQKKQLEQHFKVCAYCRGRVDEMHLADVSKKMDYVDLVHKMLNDDRVSIDGCVVTAAYHITAAGELQLESFSLPPDFIERRRYKERHIMSVYSVGENDALWRGKGRGTGEVIYQFSEDTEGISVAIGLFHIDKSKGVILDRFWAMPEQTYQKSIKFFSELKDNAKNIKLTELEDFIKKGSSS